MTENQKDSPESPFGASQHAQQVATLARHVLGFFLFHCVVVTMFILYLSLYKPIFGFLRLPIGEINKQNNLIRIVFELVVSNERP